MPPSCLLVVDEEWHNEEHLEEAANGADLYGLDSLDGFHQEGDDGEEDCGQESIEQAETWTSLWFLCVCEGKRRGSEYGGVRGPGERCLAVFSANIKKHRSDIEAPSKCI